LTLLRSTLSQRRPEFGAATERDDDDATAPGGGAGDAEEVARFYHELVDAPSDRWALPPDAEEVQKEEQPKAEDALQPSSTGAGGVLPGRREQHRGGDASAGAASAHAPSVPEPKYAIPSSNVGYRLLRLAGWREGAGIGAAEQGAAEPIQPAFQRGACGLGYEKANLASSKQGGSSGGAGAKGEVKQKRQRGGNRLPPDSLESEDTETKVRRVGAAMQAEADGAAGKEIQRYIFRAFSEPGGEANLHPLLQGRSRLSDTNPLL
jgi:hypothetical protein